MVCIKYKTEKGLAALGFEGKHLSCKLSETSFFYAAEFYDLILCGKFYKRNETI